MKFTLVCILTLGIGFASAQKSLAQACPQGCDPKFKNLQDQITKLQTDVQSAQAATPRIKTFSLTAIPQISGAPASPWKQQLKDVWKDILSIQITVGDTAMSLPFTGDTWHEGMNPPQTSQSLPTTCGAAFPPGRLTVTLMPSDRILFGEAIQCQVTAEVTLLLKK